MAAATVWYFDQWQRIVRTYGGVDFFRASVWPGLPLNVVRIVACICSFLRVVGKLVIVWPVDWLVTLLAGLLVVDRKRLEIRTETAGWMMDVWADGC